MRQKVELLVDAIQVLAQPRGTPENRPMRDTSKPANGSEAGQEFLYRTRDNSGKKKIYTAVLSGL
jgi:hypothetical protein